MTPLHRWQLPDFFSFSQGNFAQVVDIRYYTTPNADRSLHLSLSKVQRCKTRLSIVPSRKITSNNKCDPVITHNSMYGSWIVGDIYLMISAMYIHVYPKLK